MDRLAPMLAVAAEPFDSPDHLFEVKWDGVRGLAAVEKNSWCLWGRHGADYTDRYPELSMLRQLPASTILDGELIRLVGGRADFAALLRRHQLTSPRKIRWAASQQPVNYVVFDLAAALRSALRRNCTPREVRDGRVGELGGLIARSSDLRRVDAGVQAPFDSPPTRPIRPHKQRPKGQTATSLNAKLSSDGG